MELVNELWNPLHGILKMLGLILFFGLVPLMIVLPKRKSKTFILYLTGYLLFLILIVNIMVSEFSYSISLYNDMKHNTLTEAQVVVTEIYPSKYGEYFIIENKKYNLGNHKLDELKNDFEGKLCEVDYYFYSGLIKRIKVIE